MDVLYSTGSPQKALEVSESATEAHPSSSDVWYKRLSLMISCDEPIANIQEQLKQAQNLVPQKVSNYYDIMVQFLRLRS